MATQVFADEKLARLREFPDISRDELDRFFTLTPADVVFVTPGRGRGPAERLGLSVALCSLPWLGFVPDRVAAAPPVALARLAEQLDVDPSMIRSYGKRAQTRTAHLRPSPDTVVRRVVHAREQTLREAYDRVAHELTPQRRTELDAQAWHACHYPPCSSPVRNSRPIPDASSCSASVANSMPRPSRLCSWTIIVTAIPVPRISWASAIALSRSGRRGGAGGDLLGEHAGDPGGGQGVELGVEGLPKRGRAAVTNTSVPGRRRRSRCRRARQLAPARAGLADRGRGDVEGFGQ